MAASQKSRNVVESVTLWIQDIKTKGGKGFFLSDIDGLQPGNFMTAWCTSFQLKVCFSEYAYRSVLDSTQPQSVSLLLCLFCRLWRKTQLLLAWIQPIKPSRACGQRKSMVVTRICPRICSLFLWKISMFLKGSLSPIWYAAQNHSKPYSQVCFSYHYYKQ